MSAPGLDIKDHLTALIAAYQDFNISQAEELDRPPTAIEFSRFVSTNRPLVIRGGCTHLPAFKKWNVEYLKATIGQNTVDVALTPNGRADAPTLSSNGRMYLAQPCVIQERFSDFIDSILSYGYSETRPASIKYAQTQNNNLNSEYRDLLNDVSSLPWADEVFGAKVDATNLWIGTQHSRTSIHRDDYENIYLQIRGSKTFTLVPPVEAPCLGESWIPIGEWTINESESYNLKPTSEQDSNENKVPCAMWDPDDTENQSRKTAFSDLCRQVRVTLNPGDVLYLPSLWYHSVTQTCDLENNEVCIAVNFWYDMDFTGAHFAQSDFIRNISLALNHRDEDKTGID